VGEKAFQVSDEPILGVDDLLGRYLAEGRAESSGTFTLDPRKALERLAQFQLPGQYHWILKVVQSLHLSGANSIKIDAGVHKVVVTSDVVPRGFDSIDDLLAQLLADRDHSNPALRHLAAGLQGSLAVSPSQIRLLNVCDGERREFVLRAGGWRDGERSSVPKGSDHFELSLVRNLSEKLGHSWFLLNTDVFDLMFGRRGALNKENKVIFELCDYTRCQVFLGNRPTADRRFGRARFKGYEIREDPDPGKARPPVLSTWFSETNLVQNQAHPLHHLAEIVVPADEPGGFHLVAKSHATVTNRTDPGVVQASLQNGLSRAYALRMDMATDALVYFWEDGVILGRQTFACGCPGVVAIVDAKDLGKDLTTLQVLDDARLKAMMKEVEVAAGRLRNLVKQSLHLMPAQTAVKLRLGL